MQIFSNYSPFLVFGRYRRAESTGKIAGPAQESCFNLYRVLDGTLTLTHGRRRWTLRPEEAAIVDPGCEVRWGKESHFQRLAFDLVQRQRHLDGDGKIVVDDWTPQPSWRDLIGLNLPEKMDPDFLTTSQLLLHRLTTTQINHPLKHLVAHGELATFIGGFLNVLNEAQRVHPLAPHAPVELPERLEAILMHRHGTGVTVAEAAAVLGYSPEHLGRIYRRARGKTPGRFLQEWRVHSACDLLRADPKLSLDDAARAVGLANAHSLNRCFHAVLGKSPSAWRRG